MESIRCGFPKATAMVLSNELRFTVAEIPLQWFKDEDSSAEEGERMRQRMRFLNDKHVF